MEIIKQQIIVSITKTELNSLIAEAMSNPDSAAAIKRVLNPLLVDSFPQFSEFTQISLGDTDEAGTTQVILKQPAAPKSNSALKAIEPAVVINNPEETTHNDTATADAAVAPEAESESNDSEQPAPSTYVDPFGQPKSTTDIDPFGN